MSGVTRVPERAIDRDMQSLARRARNYGPLTRDPERPNEGWVWIRTDLSPPELRTSLGGTLYKIDFTNV